MTEDEAVSDDDASADIRAATRRLTSFMIDRQLARTRPTPELERGLVDDLQAVGVIVSDVWDLVNTDQRYPAAISVLMAWLDRIDTMTASADRERLREGLIRSLTVRDARPAAAALMVRQFRAVTNELVRWAAGNAISVVADSSVFADVVDIVRRRQFGIARQMPVFALPRIGGKRYRDAVIDVLVELLHDDDMALHAISAVRRLRATQAQHALQQLLDHQHPTIRRRAQDALTRLP